MIIVMQRQKEKSENVLLIHQNQVMQIIITNVSDDIFLDLSSMTRQAYILGHVLQSTKEILITAVKHVKIIGPIKRVLMVLIYVLTKTEDVIMISTEKLLVN
jgi:hypothetical protein